MKKSPLRLKREPYSGSTDSRIVHLRSGEDIGRISGGHEQTACIAYPDELADEIVKAVNQRPALLSQLNDYEERFGRLKASARKMVQAGTLDLRHLSRYPDRGFTHVRFEDYELREAFVKEDDEGHKYLGNWLELGVADLRASGDGSFLGARLGKGITDREHDSAYLVHIDLIGITFKGCWNNVSHFEAHLTTEPKEIKIWTPDFKPTEAEGAEECDGKDYCKRGEPHLIIERFTPPMYEFAHIVAGKRVSISMGPKWAEDDDG